jgi:hypothetical protein
MTAGCTAILGIDEDYVLGGSTVAGSGGENPTGGRGGDSGGAGGLPTGGLGGGGTSGTPGTGAAPSGCDACPPGTKCCENTCLEPAPIIGCGLDSCDPCPAPPERATAICRDGACATQCVPFTAQVGDQCLPVAPRDGGTGDGGDGGSPPVPCDPDECPASACNVVGPFPCCKNDDECGCTWGPGICY